MKNSQKGFIVPLLSIIIILLVSGGAYVYSQKQKMNYPVTETPSAKTASTVPTNNPTPSTANTACTSEQMSTPTVDLPPVITSITPSSGPVGTTIEIQGCNFLSFEGDKILWFINSKGEKGVLNGVMDATTRTSNTVMRVTLSQTICQFISYSGLDCPVLELAPGTYTVYSNSYGGNSNAVNFTVTAK